MIIGITGSSGAGKSTVCDILEKEYGFKIINADKIAKKLSQKGTAYLRDIVSKFGEDILLENGELNRRKLANIIYQDEEKRKVLNSCTFTYICEEIEKQIKKINKEIEEEQNRDSVRQNDKGLGKQAKIAIDAPLLLEAKLEMLCHTTIAVIAENKEEQIARIIERDKVDREHALARLKAQHTNDFYVCNCQHTIVNDGKEEEIERQIEKILKRIYCNNK